MGKSNLKEEIHKHPSFGTITIGRSQIGGGGMPLFNSPFKHHHAVSLEISPAVLHRHLHNDTIHGEGRSPHIRVYMSENQFAQLVLNAHQASGTPCTITEIGGKHVAEPPESGFKKLWAKEVKRDFKDVAEAAGEAKKKVDALLKQTRITKGDVKEIQGILSTLAQDLRANLPWLQEQFQEAMERTVAVAKAEVEAHVSSIIQRKGLEALQKDGDLPRLELSD